MAEKNNSVGDFHKAVGEDRTWEELTSDGRRKTIEQEEKKQG